MSRLRREARTTWQWCGRPIAPCGVASWQDRLSRIGAKRSERYLDVSPSVWTNLCLRSRWRISSGSRQRRRMLDQYRRLRSGLCKGSRAQQGNLHSVSGWRGQGGKTISRAHCLGFAAGPLTVAAQVSRATRCKATVSPAHAVLAAGATVRLDSRSLARLLRRFGGRLSFLMRGAVCSHCVRSSLALPLAPARLACRAR